MKQKDLALIIVVVFISVVVAFFVSNLFIATPESRSQQVEVVAPITDEFVEPDKKYFNEQSVNPTQLIEIGEITNPNPFNGN